MQLHLPLLPSPSRLPLPHSRCKPSQFKKRKKYPQVATSSFFAFIAPALFNKQTVGWLPFHNPIPSMLTTDGLIQIPPLHSSPLYLAPLPPTTTSVHMTWMRTYSWSQYPSKLLSQSAHGLSLSQGLDPRSTWFRVNLRAFSGATSTEVHIFLTD